MTPSQERAGMNYDRMPEGQEMDRLVEWKCKACGSSETMKSSAGYLQCRQCHRARGRRWAAQNRHKRKAMSDAGKAAFAKYRKRWSLKKRYGITLEEYNEMLARCWRGAARCGGCCEICRKPAKRLHVDHDHATKAVRGLLCQSCNFCIGYAYDSPANLRAAADYLCRAALKAALPTNHAGREG